MTDLLDPFKSPGVQKQSPYTYIYIYTYRYRHTYILASVLLNLTCLARFRVHGSGRCGQGVAQDLGVCLPAVGGFLGLGAAPQPRMPPQVVL